MLKLLTALEGKKTYASLAAAAVAWGVSVALRHGVDLGPISAELTEVVTFGLLALAAWARSKAKK